MLITLPLYSFISPFYPYVPPFLSYKSLSNTSLNQGYLYNYRFVSIHWGLVGSAATQLKTMVSPHSESINSHSAAGAYSRIPTVSMIECLQGQSWGLSSDSCNCQAFVSALVVWSPYEGIF